MGRQLGETQLTASAVAAGTALTIGDNEEGATRTRSIAYSQCQDRDLAACRLSAPKSENSLLAERSSIWKNGQSKCRRTTQTNIDRAQLIRASFLPCSNDGIRQRRMQPRSCHHLHADVFSSSGPKNSIGRRTTRPVTNPCSIQKTSVRATCHVLPVTKGRRADSAERTGPIASIREGSTIGMSIASSRSPISC